MADNVESLSVARFNNCGDDPAKCRPTDALDAAYDWIKNLAPEDRPEHIIVLTGRTTADNASGTRYFQSGNYPAHGMLGLCIEGMHMIRESNS